jgi:DNA-directed RNA polymerase subunit M/transcription elongation factor TFIIS
MAPDRERATRGLVQRLRAQSLRDEQSVDEGYNFRREAEFIENTVFSMHGTDDEGYGEHMLGEFARMRVIIREEDEDVEEMLAKNWEEVDSFFKCTQCHLKHTHWYLKQTRSADEPMTVFISCLKPDCKAKYSFNP